MGGHTEAALTLVKAVLTQVAERLGAEKGSVTDVCMPRWLARNLSALHAPLIGLAGVLHARNLLSPPRVGAAEGQ